MTNSTRPLLAAPADSGLVDLPAHDYVDGVCRYCDEAIADRPFASFEAYLDNFWGREYEGEPSHRPMEREEFDYLAASCLA